MWMEQKNGNQVCPGSAWLLDHSVDLEYKIIFGSL